MRVIIIVSPILCLACARYLVVCVSVSVCLYICMYVYMSVYLSVCVWVQYAYVWDSSLKPRTLYILAKHCITELHALLCFILLEVL